MKVILERNLACTGKIKRLKINKQTTKNCQINIQACKDNIVKCKIKNKEMILKS